MTYDGRAVMAMVAETHGWTIIPGVPAHDPEEPNGNDIVAYQRADTQIRIEWTPQNTTAAIVKNVGDSDQAHATGPLGLVTARGWLEEQES